MNQEEPNSATEQADGSPNGLNVSPDCTPAEKCADDFSPKIDLPGKNDSGPEPDVFGREIPPQD